MGYCERKHSLSFYNDVLKEIAWLMEENRNKHSYFGRTISRVGSLLNPRYNGLTEDMWEAGKGRVNADTYKNVEKAKEILAGIIEDAEDAHGNSSLHKNLQWFRPLMGYLEAFELTQKTEAEVEAEAEAERKRKELREKLTESSTELDRLSSLTKAMSYAVKDDAIDEVALHNMAAMIEEVATTLRDNA